MADISFKIRAEQLGKSIDNLAPELENEIQEAVKNLSHAAYSAMINKVQNMSSNPQNRQDYLKNLKFETLGNNEYLIYLDGEWPNKLESGFGSYSIRDAVLKSNKTVQVGSRAGQPWVRTAKDGHKYGAVPFEHKPFSKDSGGDLASDIKKLVGTGLDGTRQKITKIFKGTDGSPLSGKVASVMPNDTDIQNLKNLTKYQHVSPGGKVSSVYMTYRMVSETGKDWIHPGFGGYHLFREAEEFVSKEMDNIINTLLK